MREAGEVVSRANGTKVGVWAPNLLGRYRPLWPYLRWGLFVVGLVVVVGSLAGVIPYGDGVNFGDGTNYWEGQAYTDEHYRYSPAFLWVTAPLRLLPLEAFMWVWTALHVAAVLYLGPWLLAVPFVADDAISGNINTFLAVAVVVAVRSRGIGPAAWSAVLLTKVTPGVGVLVHWRDWRAMTIALGTTAAIVAIGALIDPHLWTEWFRSLQAGSSNYPTIDVLAPLPVRMAAGAVLCVLASRWLWLLPVGMVVAMPGLWPSSFALLAAIPRLVNLERNVDPADGEIDGRTRPLHGEL